MNELIQAPGFDYIYPEHGKSYSIKVGTGEHKIVITRTPYHETGYTDNWQYGYDKDLKIDLIKEEYDEELDEEEME